MAMALEDLRATGIGERPISADYRARLVKIMLDRPKTAQIFQVGDIDMPIVDLVAALPQEIADHVLARPFRAAGAAARDQIPRGRELRANTSVARTSAFLPGIDGVHLVRVAPCLSRNRAVPT